MGQALLDRLERRRSDLLALFAIALPFTIGWMLVAPWQDVPVIDDWVYAWSVEHLLKTGELRVADISAVYPVAHVLWGALFARIAGLSFGVLRLSTVVLAVVGCWAIYFTLRELALGVLLSLLAALAVAWHPVYFAMAFSFMTDVPFAAVSAVALYFYVSGVRRGNAGRLWWGTAVAVIAFLVRPLAIVLPLAVVAALARGVQERGGLRRMMAPIAAGAVSMTALWVVLPLVFGPLEGASVRQEGLKYWFMVTPREYAAFNGGLLAVAPFPFVPLFAPMLARRRVAVGVVVVSVVLFAALGLTIGYIPSPMPDWQTWSFQDIAARAMLGGSLPPSTLSSSMTPFVRVAGIVIVSTVIVCVAMLLAARVTREEHVLLAAGGLHILLMNLLWFYNDRYYIVLIPTLAYIAAAALARLGVSRATAWLMAPLLAVWSFFCVTGTRDMLATNQACADEARELEAQGVPPWEIDAGYALNGWRLYVHPDHLPPGADRRYDVPFVNSERETLYRIVNRPLEGYDVVKMTKLPEAIWQASDRVYVIKKK